jgi:hypothetical protein
MVSLEARRMMNAWKFWIDAVPKWCKLCSCHSRNYSIIRAQEVFDYQAGVEEGTRLTRSLIFHSHS